MSIMNLHFAIGMGFGLLLCSILYLKYKEIQLYAPLIMTAFGLWAVIPEIFNLNISFYSNIFVFYPLISSIFSKGQYLGFIFVLFLYNIGIIGQIMCIKK